MNIKEETMEKLAEVGDPMLRLVIAARGYRRAKRDLSARIGKADGEEHRALERVFTAAHRELLDAAGAYEESPDA